MEKLYMKIKDHGRDFKALIVPKTIQNYLLYESHNGLDHNGTTRLYQFLKRQYYWKGLKESAQKFVRNCPQCETNFANTKLCATLSRNTPNPNRFYFSRLNWPI